MSSIHQYTWFNGKTVPTSQAVLSVGSSAVLYGLSVYTVCYAKRTADDFLLFRLSDHIQRLHNSSALLGFSAYETLLSETMIQESLTELLHKNQPDTDVFFRITLHCNASVPGPRTSDLPLTLSIFSYPAESILDPAGAHVKISPWTRVSNEAIPPKAKVNGAYVNSALAKQDALDTGYDDALFLNQAGNVSEFTAANIFLVKNGELITPDIESDILEGITRRSIIELAREQEYTVTERAVTPDELFTADEVFACGTSAAVAPITNINELQISDQSPGIITTKLQTLLQERQQDHNHSWTMNLSI